MLTQNTHIKNALLICSLLLLVACGKETNVSESQKAEPQKQTAQNISTDKQSDKDAKKATANKNTEATEITWDELIPEDYDPNAAINGYIEQLESLDDNDQKAMEIYGKIQAELDNAPVNVSLDGRQIKMPGFIAPLENQNGVIDEFLLVPYFGACIHSPPPPMNQTVMVKAKKGTGVKSEDSSYPVWITGKIVAVEERTTIGAAGYRIENPYIEPYEEEQY